MINPDKKKLQSYMQSIAKLYGCNIIFSNGNTSSFCAKNKTIELGSELCRDVLVICFCHELGHFLNQCENKFQKYHNPKIRPLLSKVFKNNGLLISYYLRAEIYTDKVGSYLCGMWFPETEYIFSYKNNKQSYNFLKNHYLQAS